MEPNSIPDERSPESALQELPSVLRTGHRPGDQSGSCHPFHRRDERGYAKKTRQEHMGGETQEDVKIKLAGYGNASGINDEGFEDCVEDSNIN